jgi:hypothetical protein
MTEAEWLACTDPTPMLESLRGKASSRKLRLFAVACCRHLLGQVAVNPWDRNAVEVAEHFAEGKASPDELEGAAAATTPDWTAAYACAEAASLEGGADAAIFSADNAAHAAGEHAASQVDADDDHPAFAAGQAAEREAQATFLRDIVGNPFRPVTIDPSWLMWDGAAVRHLAQAIYDERAFDRLPILADALEEAGCTSEELLAHCRAGGGHVRGCWAVDLLLGKE